MTVKTEFVDYHHGDTVLEAFIAYDTAVVGPRPAVLVSHAWNGRDQLVCDRAIRLAELGYLGFALDMYGKGVLGGSPEDNAALMVPFMEHRGKLQERQRCALDAVRALPQADPVRVAAIGYCFGGLCVLDLARSGADLMGVVSIHGLLKPPGNTVDNKISAKVLVLHGHDDPLAPIDELVALQRELTTAQCDWQTHTYGHTMHAFTNPHANDPDLGTVYNPHADRRSWRILTAFLAEVFGDLQR